MRKIFLIVFVLALAFAVPASGGGDRIKITLGLLGGSSPITGFGSGHEIPDAGRWQEKTVSSAILLTSMSAIDFLQTKEMLYDRTGYREVDPLLEEKPSQGKLVGFGVAALVVTYLVDKWLPEPWDRIFIDSVISSEKWNITDNKRLLEGEERRINGIPFILTFKFD